jgi:DNA-binding CsgD family transcriptional regulator
MSYKGFEYWYNKKTKEVMSDPNYTKMVLIETAGVDGIDGIKAICDRIGFEPCMRDVKSGKFYIYGGDEIEGLELTENISTLTPTEIKIANMVKQARRNLEIAEEMGIGEGTVRTHMRSIFRKLKIKSRAELIIKEL